MNKVYGTVLEWMSVINPEYTQEEKNKAVHEFMLIGGFKVEDTELAILKYWRCHGQN